jgi:hypothetical protein
MRVKGGDVIAFAKIGDRAASPGDYLWHYGKTALVHERLPASLAFAGASTNGSASWEQLRGGERMQHA